MANAVADAALDVIFREARTHNGWLPRPVDDDLLHRVYDLAKMGPTSANTCPMRIVFVKTAAAKERLKPASWRRATPKRQWLPPVCHHCK